MPHVVGEGGRAVGHLCCAPRHAEHHAAQVCRCMPYIHKTMRLEELVSVKDMRSVVKEKFKQYKDVTDPRVSRGGAPAGPAQLDAGCGGLVCLLVVGAGERGGQWGWRGSQAQGCPQSQQHAAQSRAECSWCELAC